MTSRSLLIACALVLVLARTAFAAGMYQLATDGQTYVWNNYPKPGDEASWSGGKDNEGYATGDGILTWSKRGKLMTRYWGRMVRGRLEGEVTNEDASGKRFRGTFINGAISGDWREAPNAPASPPSVAGETLQDFLNRKDAEINAAYHSCLAAFRGRAQENLRIAQRAWIVFTNKNEAAAELVGLRRGLTKEELIREAAKEVEARTEQLRTFFNLPKQDLSACRREWDAAERDLTVAYNEVLAALAPDEQEKVREAQRAWIQFREKSAASHDADATGRAPIWDRVVIDQRRTQELRDFYLGRLAGSAPLSPSTIPASPSPSTESKFSNFARDDSSRAVGVTPTPTVPAHSVASPMPSQTDAPVRARIISDFKDDVRALFKNVSSGGSIFKSFMSLKDVVPLSAPASEAITKGAEKAREFRSKVGYAESLRECAAETTLIDALVAYDQSVRAIHSGDGPTAQTTVGTFLRDHAQSPAEEYKTLWGSLTSLDTVFTQASKEASRHLDQAQGLVGADKTSEAIKEYEMANSIFPDPKIGRTVKRLKEESLGL